MHKLEESMFDNLPDIFYISVYGGAVVARETDPNRGTISTEVNVDEDLLDIINEKIKEIEASMPGESILSGRGLARYISSSDIEFEKDVASITLADLQQLDEKEIETIFRVKLNENRIHSNEDIVNFCGNFIIEQCSDGWGEDLEQRPIMKDTLGEYCSNSSNLYFSPWTKSSGWDFEYSDVDLYESTNQKCSYKESSSQARRLADYIDGDTFYLSVINGKIFVEGIYEWDEDDDPVKTRETLEDVSYGLLDVLTSSLENVDDISKGKGLAEYVAEEYRSDIVSIIFDHTYVCGRNGQIATMFKIEFNRSRPNHYIEDIIDYVGRFLVSQCSDGWGEAFEQRAFCEEAEEYCDMIGDMFFSPCTLDSKWVPEIEMLQDEEEYFEESIVRLYKEKITKRRQLREDVKSLLGK